MDHHLPFLCFRVVVVDYTLDQGETYNQDLFKVMGKDCVSDRAGGGCNFPPGLSRNPANRRDTLEIN